MSEYAITYQGLQIGAFAAAGPKGVPATDVATTDRPVPVTVEGKQLFVSKESSELLKGRDDLHCHEHGTFHAFMVWAESKLGMAAETISEPKK